MMNKENDHNLVKSAYIVGALLLVIGVVSSIGLFFGNEENGTNEQINNATKTNLSGEERRRIEETINSSASPVKALSEAEKQKIEANFNRKTSSGRISPEDEMRH